MDVCGQYASIFALFMDRGLDPRQFVDLFGTTESDMQVETALVYAQATASEEGIAARKVIVFIFVHANPMSRDGNG